MTDHGRWYSLSSVPVFPVSSWFVYTLMVTFHTHFSLSPACLQQHTGMIALSFCSVCWKTTTNMGAVRIMSWYPELNGSHFGLPPSSIHRMTGLGGNFPYTYDVCIRPHCDSLCCVQISRRHWVTEWKKKFFTHALWIPVLQIMTYGDYHPTWHSRCWRKFEG